MSKRKNKLHLWAIITLIVIMMPVFYVGFNLRAYLREIRHDSIWLWLLIIAALGVVVWLLNRKRWR